MRAPGFRAVLVREIRTSLRTPSTALLAFTYLGLALGVAWYTEAVKGGYLAVAASLATPTELVVGVVGFALGYRVVVADRTTGELDLTRTYGLSASSYVAGVYFGRLAVVAVVVLTPVVVLAGLVPFYGGPRTTIVAWHGGVDSPLLLARYGLLSLAYGASALAVSVMLSSVSRDHRAALASVVVAWIGLALGVDLMVSTGLSFDVVDESWLAWLTSTSPTTAYRGLVLEYVVGVGIGDVRATYPVPSLLGLTAWTVVPLWIAKRSVW
ncbi:MAG: ABC transporter permease [Halobacteriales archaeon]